MASDPKYIRVQIRSVYGNDLIYPLCDVARAFADIAGTKTLNRLQLRQIRRIGYTVISCDQLGTPMAELKVA